MPENEAGIEVVISDFGGVLTSPLVESFMAFQDQTGITTETLGKAMQAASEANGDNPLFEMERGEIIRGRLPREAHRRPRAAARPCAGAAPLQRDLLRGAAAQRAR